MWDLSGNLGAKVVAHDQGSVGTETLTGAFRNKQIAPGKIVLVSAYLPATSSPTALKGYIDSQSER